jgi:hypothetical protein
MIVKHLGNGIMSFDEVVDTSDFEAYLERIYAENLDATHGVNAESSTNDGGYMVEQEHVSKMPTRFYGLSCGSEFTKGITTLINDGIYRCLVEYCRSFPVAIECIGWRTSGQIASYSIGQTIGPHSDCALPYDKDGNVLNSFPLHNTLTGSMALNEDFEGGDIKFRPWGITVRPKIGSVLIYPSSFIGCHEVEPITSGVRNSYLQWFCQGDTNMEVQEENKLSSLSKDVQHFGQGYVHVGIVQHV